MHILEYYKTFIDLVDKYVGDTFRGVVIVVWGIFEFTSLISASFGWANSITFE
jgi:hypothetical protein